jgi:hypothetical protein
LLQGLASEVVSLLRAVSSQMQGRAVTVRSSLQVGAGLTGSQVSRVASSVKNLSAPLHTTRTTVFSAPLQRPALWTATKAMTVPSNTMSRAQGQVQALFTFTSAIALLQQAQMHGSMVLRASSLRAALAKMLGVPVMAVPLALVQPTGQMVAQTLFIRNLLLGKTGLMRGQAILEPRTMVLAQMRLRAQLVTANQMTRTAQMQAAVSIAHLDRLLGTPRGRTNGRVLVRGYLWYRDEVVVVGPGNRRIRVIRR